LSAWVPAFAGMTPGIAVGASGESLIPALALKVVMPAKAATQGGHHCMAAPGLPLFAGMKP